MGPKTPSPIEESSFELPPIEPRQYKFKVDNSNETISNALDDDHCEKSSEKIVHYHNENVQQYIDEDVHDEVESGKQLTTNNENNNNIRNKIIDINSNTDDDRLMKQKKSLMKELEQRIRTKPNKSIQFKKDIDSIENDSSDLNRKVDRNDTIEFKEFKKSMKNYDVKISNKPIEYSQPNNDFVHNPNSFYDSNKETRKILNDQSKNKTKPIKSVGLVEMAQIDVATTPELVSVPKESS